jgi:phage tail tube protein FII
LLRTNPIDSHYRSFFQGTKRQFEVQVQGKFKRKPTGEIYVGADITKKMELGILTRSMCRMVLKFVGTMVNDLHYSFGDSPNAKDAESPHLVAPLLRGMDKVVVTGAI